MTDKRIRSKKRRISNRKLNHPNIESKEYPLHDYLLCKVMFNYKNRVNVNWIRQIKARCPNIQQYLDNRYCDSSCVNETLYRMLMHIEIRPTCVECGKPVQYLGIGEFSKRCSVKCASISNSVVQKRKKTCLEKYGDEIPQRCEVFKEKTRQTCIKKYGVSSFWNSEKCKQIRKEKYGVEYPLQSKNFQKKCQNSFVQNVLNNPTRMEIMFEKRKQTCLDQYGEESFSKTKEFRKMMHDRKDEINQKKFETKKRNGTLNSSYEEQHLYQMILKKYPDCVTQYQSVEYPFLCDFYIPSENVYIEYQGFPSHGEKPYEKTKEDIETVKKWKEKGYQGWAYDWTNRDVRKRHTAIKNNLRWIEFFYYDEEIILSTIEQYIKENKQGVLSVYKKEEA